ncbi:MAG TPA: hypothetical protein VF189_05340 [Patescibacteria group bacterium]
MDSQILSNQPELLKPKSSSGISYITAIIIILVLLILSMIGYVLYIKSYHPTQNASPLVSPTQSMQIKTTDLAPGIPANEKTILTIQHSDSSRERIILKSDLVAGYIKSLPEGEKMVSKEADN